MPEFCGHLLWMAPNVSSGVCLENKGNCGVHTHVSTSYLCRANLFGLFYDFYRAMLCIRGTSNGPVSVRPSQVGVLLKWLNVGSHKQHHTIAQDSSFLMPKIYAKFDRGHPLRGHQMQVGRVKIGEFPQITGYISKTVQDRCMVSIKVE